LLLQQVGFVQHGVRADVGVAGGGFDFGDLARVGGELAHAGFEFDAVIVGEFVGMMLGSMVTFSAAVSVA
jgi:hypothetical protein